MVLLKGLLILCCAIMVYQDLKERAVLWVLFPLIGALVGILHFMHTEPKIFLLSILINLLLVSAVVLILWIYTLQIKKQKFLNKSIGLGDLLLFYALALGFPTFTFVILFVGALLFSLGASFWIQRKHPLSTIPLAGYMGLFLIAVLVASLFPNAPSLFLY